MPNGDRQVADVNSKGNNMTMDGRLVKLGTIAIASLLALGNQSFAQSRRSAVTERAITPSQYAERVANLNSCDRMEAQSATLPNAAPLLSAFASGNRAALRRDEFETTEQFNARLSDLVVRSVGDPDRLLVRIPIESYKITYDADRQIVTIKYLADWTGSGSEQTVEFHKRDLDRSRHLGTNAFGVTTTVSSVRQVRDVLLFSGGQLVGDRGSYNFPEWDIPMGPAQAREFKGNAYLLVLASARPPYIESRSSYAGATLDIPVSLSQQTNRFHVRLLCGAFVYGDGRVVRTDLVASQSEAIRSDVLLPERGVRYRWSPPPADRR